MALQRLLKFFNYGLAVALVVVLACAYWFAWRPLPKTSGSIGAPVAARASVTRDSLGVPHILAASQPDALFLQGYVTAQDRLFQMDALRRLAAGELAEVLGRGALESDRQARRLRLWRVAEEYARRLPAADRAVFAAYARGVNFFLETNRNRLPLEFSLLRYDPRPWSIADSLLIALHMMSTLERSWRSDLRREMLAAGGDPKKVDFLFANGSGGESRPGSNAWAVSGALTASRRPLLAGDPHLEFSLPSIWHMVHLRAPKLNVSGVSVPGLPGVLIGHNDRVAWSITSLQFDVQDLYVEKFDAATGRYLFHGQVEQARGEGEVMRVRGGPSETAVVWTTRHGPIFLAEGGRFLSLRWSAFESPDFQFPILDLNRARNWQEFRTALARFPGPGSNFVYADADGNIGYQAAGRLPVRKNFDGGMPLDGSTGEFEWEGIIPFEKLPSVYNPPSGMIVSANQNPFPRDYPYRAGGDFAAPYRFEQIQARLKAQRGWRPGQMLSIQTDLYSTFDQFLAREMVAAYDRRGKGNPALSDAIGLLRTWNGQMTTGSPVPLITNLSYQHLRRAIAERASRGKGLAYRSMMAPVVIEKLLRDRPKEWFDNYDQLLLENLAEALEEGRRMQGQNVVKWDYGRTNRIVLNNLVLGGLPVIGKYFNIGIVPLGGSPGTVQQFSMERGVGPSMRMVVDFSDLDQSVQNITTGESGQVLSRHYRDQWNDYRAGRSFPMQFHRIDASDTLVFTPGR
ncbi:MAG: penicillin acylase family protein [Acidobacteriales bacterium]|nr:MAG: penicillin acylase family protein [Terriglobales bacterium]